MRGARVVNLVNLVRAAAGRRRVLVIAGLQVVLWVLLVPWFFIPLGEIFVFGVPLWLWYCVVLFLVYAVTVALLLRFQWFRLAGEASEGDDSGGES